MAGFTTNNDIDLFVDKSADIALNVDKTVTSSFMGENVLADAEAFADASGFVGGGTGSRIEEFLIDDFSDLQSTTVNALNDVLVNIGRAPGPDFPMVGQIGQEPFPDGETFTGTDLPPDALRIFAVQLLENTGLAGLTSTNDPNGMADLSDDRLDFNNSVNGQSNQFALYTRDGDGDGDFGDGIGDAFALIDPSADLSDPNTAIVFTDVEIEGLDNGGTLRFETQITDAAGHSATARAAITEDFVTFTNDNEVDIVLPLGFFLNGFGPSGVPIADGLIRLDSDANAALNLQEVVSIELRLLTDPSAAPPALPASPLPSAPPLGEGASASSLPEFQPLPGGVEELPDNGGIDADLDDILIRQVIPEENEGALLAETLTVTQVEENLASAFSQSISGFDPGDTLLFA